MLQRLCFALLAAASFVPVASAQTADELVAKYLAAKGGISKIKSVQSMKMTGKIFIGEMEAPFALLSKRPKMVRTELTIQGMKGIQAYDGKRAWSLMPFMGNGEAVLMSPEQTRTLDERADFDGPLVDYKQKGHRVRLVGRAQVDSIDAYQLELTMKDASVRNIYLDAKTYLEVMTESKHMVSGMEVSNASRLGDYRKVDGMMIAHSIEMGVEGIPQRQRMVLDAVLLNPNLPDSLFAAPRGARPAARDSVGRIVPDSTGSGAARPPATGPKRDASPPPATKPPAPSSAKPKEGNG